MLHIYIYIYDISSLRVNNLRKGNILEIEKREQYIAHWRELNMEAVTDLSQVRLPSEWMKFLFQTCSLIQTSFPSYHEYAYAYKDDQVQKNYRISSIISIDIHVSVHHDKIYENDHQDSTV